jgi:hypothetical protein
VDVNHSDITYTLRGDAEGELLIRHAGDELTLCTSSPSTIAVKKRKPLLPAPAQPPGRAPTHRYG